MGQVIGIQPTELLPATAVALCDCMMLVSLTDTVAFCSLNRIHL